MHKHRWKVLKNKTNLMSAYIHTHRHTDRQVRTQATDHIQERQTDTYIHSSGFIDNLWTHRKHTSPMIWNKNRYAKRCRQKALTRHHVLVCMCMCVCVCACLSCMCVRIRAWCHAMHACYRKLHSAVICFLMKGGTARKRLCVCYQLCWHIVIHKDPSLQPFTRRRICNPNRYWQMPSVSGVALLLTERFEVSAPDAFFII